MSKRAFLKGFILYCIFAFLLPLMPDWSVWSVYNTQIIPGRQRFAFSAYPSSETYNVRIDNLSWLFRTHEISGEKKIMNFELLFWVILRFGEYFYHQMKQLQRT